MKKIIFPITFVLSIFSMAQIKQGDVNVNRKDDIQQGSVTVNRVYEPNVEAAEKIKQTPQEKTEIQKKYQPSYTPKDLAAASDFETSTLRAEELPVENSRNFRNYFEAGYGNNSNLDLNAFVDYEFDESSTIGVSAGYRSAKANLKNSIIDDGFTHFNADGFYRYNLANAVAKVGIGARLSGYDLYGYAPEITSTQIGKNNYLSYTHLKAYGIYDIFDSYWLNDIKAEYHFFRSNYKSRENHIKLNANVGSKDLFDFSLLGSESFGLISKGNLEFLNSHFDFSFLQQRKAYNFLNLGLTPQIAWLGDFIDITAGANIQYLNQPEGQNKVYIAPQAEFTVKPTPEFNFLGGINGGVDLRSFQELADFNPYLFGHQALEPSINRLGFYIGLKGDVGSDFKYTVTAGYQKLENILGFLNVPLSYSSAVPFGNGNTFHSYYDDGNRNHLEANINYFGINNLDLNAVLNYQKFNLNNLKEVYEVPTLQASLGANYRLLQQKLKLGGDIFFVGSRKTWVGEDFSAGEEANLNSYLDLNLNARYQITNQWNVFIKGQNLINNNYQRFYHYRVQGAHIIGGIMFKF